MEPTKRVMYVWVNYPNDLYRNRVASFYEADLYAEYDEFQNTVPCWMVHRNAKF